MTTDQSNEILYRIDALEAEVKRLRRVVEQNHRSREKSTRSRFDPLLSPRELAELILGHKEYPREPRVLRAMRSRIDTACRTYNDDKIEREHRDYYGLKCEPLTGNRRRQILKSEGLRWATRLQLWGLRGSPTEVDRRH